MITRRGLWPSLLLVIATACSVDETGYLDTGSNRGLDGDDGVTGGGPDPGASDTSDGKGVVPDEVGDALYYLTPGPLTVTPVPVTFVMPSGTLSSEASLTLTLTVAGGDPIPLTVVDGGFVEITRAALADEVRVIDADGDVIARRTLSDDLTTQAPPTEHDASDTGTPTDSGATPGFSAPAVSDGEIQVGDGALPVAVPYLAYVPETGAAAYVVAGRTDVALTARSGDQLCLARPDATSGGGLTVCTVLD